MAVDSPPRCRREGEYWTIEFAGELVRLRDTKGLHYLARLLDNPWREFDVLELVSGRAEPGGAAAALSDAAVVAGDPEARERVRSAVTKRIKDTLRRIHGCHPDLGFHLTRSVRTGYACAYEPYPDLRWIVG